MKRLHVVCGIIEVNHQFLIAQRGKGIHENIWEFPGGKIEENETNEEAIIRELKEELNLCCKVIKYVSHVEDIRDDLIIDVYAYLCHLESGDINISVHKQYRWVNISEIYQYQFEPCDKQILDNLALLTISKKTNELKVLRDPIHRYIHVNYQIIWDCINSKEMQRLRRIHQLGGDSAVYHTAEHTRFAHSLGVYEIVRRLVYEVQSINEQTSEYDKLLLMIAGLLHDIGHGPFSHAFEHISGISHEQITLQIISNNSEINHILTSYHPLLVHDLQQIFTKSYPKPFFYQIISAQLDADRMDYLLRDAYFTGTSYGNFDLERVIRTIRCINNQLVVKESGIHSIEDYIMARYHMYWQVYLHPVARSNEIIIQNLFKRLVDLAKINNSYYHKYPMFKLLFEPKLDNETFFKLDENATYYGFSLMQDDEDVILSDLAKRILNRKLFEYEEYHSCEQYEKQKKILISNGYDINYYLYIDVTSQAPYSFYSSDKDSPIYILKSDNKIMELSQASNIVKALTNAHLKAKQMLYYPLI